MKDEEHFLMLLKHNHPSDELNMHNIIVLIVAATWLDLTPLDASSSIVERTLSINFSLKIIIYITINLVVTTKVSDKIYIREYYCHNIQSCINLP